MSEITKEMNDAIRAACVASGVTDDVCIFPNCACDQLPTSIRAALGVAKAAEGNPLDTEALAAEIVALKAERDEARVILAHNGIGGLPYDWTLKQVAEARINDIIDLRWKVRDTCSRAERAESELATLRSCPTVQTLPWWEER